MTLVFDLSECGLDVVPAPFVVEAAPDQRGYERTPTAGAHSSIEFRDKLIVQRYVQTHVYNIAHNLLSDRAGRGCQKRVAEGAQRDEGSHAAESHRRTYYKS